MTPAEEAAAIAEYDVEWTDALLFGTKVCVVCGKKRPNCSSYFYKGGSKDGGLKAACKECVKARSSASSKAHSEERAAKQRERYRQKRLAKESAS